MLTQLKARRGFSLIELAVVLIIIGIIAAIAIPTFQAVIARSQDRADISSGTAIGRNALALHAAGGTTSGAPSINDFTSAATEANATNASDRADGNASTFSAQLSNGRTVYVNVISGSPVSASVAP